MMCYYFSYTLLTQYIPQIKDIPCTVLYQLVANRRRKSGEDKKKKKKVRESREGLAEK